MALPLYLAMTGKEIACQALPERLAYMACHFSPYGEGLCDFPPGLPKGSMLILDDRIPVWRHDPVRVAEQLAELIQEYGCSGCLLDFQRPVTAQAIQIVRAVNQALPCPVAVTEHYAEGSSCAVFLAAPGPNKPLRDIAAKWAGRELWLEAALETVQYTLDKGGNRREPIPYRLPDVPFHRHEGLCCTYHMDISQTQAVFTISRTPEDVEHLLAQAEELGFAQAVGLYQQLGVSSIAACHPE